MGQPSAPQFTFRCDRCDEEHTGVPTFAFKWPVDAEDIPESERDERMFLSDDACVIDDAQFYVRGVLEIAVRGLDSPLAWVVWVKVSEEEFDRSEDLFGVERRAHEPPLTGLMASPPRPYPDTAELTARVQFRDDGVRPLVVLDKAEHPLVVEQRDGITQQRLKEIVVMMIHKPGRN